MLDISVSDDRISFLFKQNKFETIPFSYKLFDLNVAQLQCLAKGVEYNRYLIRVPHCVELQMN